MDIQERLRKARLDRGIKTLSEAARLLGVPYTTYYGHEQGLRGIKIDEIQHYARVFRVQPAWLAFGPEPTPKARRITLGGQISSTQSPIPPTGESQASLVVEVPISSEIEQTGFEVTGSQFSPRLSDGDLVIAGAIEVPEESKDKNCIVFEGHNVTIGRLVAGTDRKRFHLEGWDGVTRYDLYPESVRTVLAIVFRSAWVKD